MDNYSQIRQLTDCRDILESIISESVFLEIRTQAEATRTLVDELLIDLMRKDLRAKPIERNK